MGLRVIDAEQRSAEWHEARTGVPTASGFSKLITPDGRPSKAADGYITSLIREKIFGDAENHKTDNDVKSYWLQRGIDLEPCAVSMYELLNGVDVQLIGLCLHDDIEAGASPDGLIGDDGGLEIKCPSPRTHQIYLDEEKLPDKYKAQVMGCLWITGRKWWDFMSYHPDMDPVVIRVERDEEYIEKLSQEVIKAVNKINGINEE